MVQVVIHITEALGVLTILMLGVVGVQKYFGSESRSMARNAAIGAMLGLVIVIVMLDPIKLSEGGTFDPRGGPAILAGVVAGPVGAFIAMLFGAAARWYLVGGPYAMGGVVGFALYAAFGIVAGVIFRKYNIQTTIYTLAGLGLFGSVAVVPAFFINADFDLGLKILQKAGPILLVNNIFGTLIVGLFIMGGNRWQKVSQQLQNEQAENARLALIAQSTTNGIVVSDDTGVTEWVNKSFERMTGFSLDEVKGQRLGRLLQGADSDPQVIKEMSDKIRQKEGFDVTLVNYHKNGQAYWIHIECHPFHEADGTLKFMAVQTDVSSQVKAQQALRESERRFRDFAEASSDWLWEMDADSRITFISEQIEVATGKPVSSFIGKTREELTGDDYHTDKWAEMRDAIKSRQPFKDFQYARSGQNGSLQYISTSGVPYYDENGLFCGYRGTGSDITAQQSIYDRAVQAEEQLRTAIESLEDGFVLYDADDRLILCNEKFRQIYALCEDLLIPGQRFSDIIRISAARGQNILKADEIEEWIARRIMDHSVKNAEHEREMPNGQWLKISESATPQGGIVGFHIDITQLKLAKQNAEAASHAKSNFLSTMSHEIRTPLNGVLGIAQLLADTHLDEDQRKKVNIILSSGQTLLAIINDVLDMSKIEAGGIELENHAFSLDSLVSGIASPFQTLAENKGLKLEVNNQIASGLVIEGDSVRLRQIIWNLLSNAIKFTNTGTITLTLEDLTDQSDNDLPPDGQLIHFSVKDSGLGIAPDRIDAIFDAFAQEDNSITRKYGGTGLGLTIVKQLTELMGGRIAVSSELNVGTVFDVYIPFGSASSAEVANISLRDDDSANHNPEPLNVLIAEDNEVNAIIAKAFLEKFGHQVKHVVNGKLAVEAAKDGWADFILMDIHMPEMDGVDATKAIRETEFGKTVPIVGLTAEAFAERHALFMEAGMNGVLTKPFTEQQLFETLAIHRKEDRRRVVREPEPVPSGPA
ncbi:MAG: PAS domain S-box protein [Rhodospirillales bacterium]|nr:PAS domain S-box protein [Rhodospirillales bacterium]